MLLTIGAGVSTGDLGYLLHKNPARIHTFELPFGAGRVVFGEPRDGLARASLIVDVDPVELVRGSAHSSAEGMLDQYVNDRPYAASSFLSVALSRVFGTALGGRSKERQELADAAIDFEVTVAVLACRGGEEFVRALFEPLGYRVEFERHPLDEQFPEWGEGDYRTLVLRGCVRLRDLLSHLYVLIPVIDGDKHYGFGVDEVEKLIEKGEGWLAVHPAKEKIVSRYLRHDRKLTREALTRLVEDAAEMDAVDVTHRQEEAAIEAPIRLWEQRMGAVMAVLEAEDAGSVVDVGCGEGRLLKELLANRRFRRITGMDVSWRALETAQRRLHLEQMAPAQRERIQLIHGSLLYRDERLAGFDAATAIEVIEHLDPPRLAAFERVIFEAARPRVVVVTTPNAEYNVCFPTLPAGQFRHRDHRFEWTRAEFENWSARIAERFGYRVRFLAVGSEDPAVGSPTQMGVFTR